MIQSKTISLSAMETLFFVFTVCVVGLHVCSHARVNVTAWYIEEETKCLITIIRDKIRTN